MAFVGSLDISMGLGNVASPRPSDATPMLDCMNFMPSPPGLTVPAVADQQPPSGLPGASQALTSADIQALAQVVLHLQRQLPHASRPTPGVQESLLPPHQQSWPSQAQLPVLPQGQPGLHAHSRPLQPQSPQQPAGAATSIQQRMLSAQAQGLEEQRRQLHGLLVASGKVQSKTVLTGQPVAGSSLKVEDSGDITSWSTVTGEAMSDAGSSQEGLDAAFLQMAAGTAPPLVASMPAPAEMPLTTLVVRNIPGMYTQEMLMQEWPNLGTYDFLYLPYNTVLKRNLSYAFINFTLEEDALRFWQQWHKRRLTLFSPKKCLNISYADVQGRNDNLLQLKKKRVIRIKVPQGMPVIFQDGVQVPLDVVLAALEPGKVAARN